MSSSNTNIETQARRHRGPLVGIALAVVFAALLFGGLMAWTAYQPSNPTAESPATLLSDG